ncbi:MAG: lipoyl(octanoyl) transferase LipB [Bacteroidota bacterium]
MNQVIPIDLGLVDYKKAWDFQEELFQKSVQQKIALRNGKSEEKTKNYMIFCQHPHVYTLGKSGSSEHLLLNENQLEEKEANFYQINRGGDITYHGPGQLVVYPILDLDYFFTDIHKYMRFLEEAVIQTLKEFGIEGNRVKEYTGVWLDVNTENARKICAMGVKCSRWVTMHGIGFNINSDLSYFSHIIPCGIEDKSVTSMQKELGFELDMEKVIEVFKQKISQLFEFEFLENKIIQLA